MGAWECCGEYNDHSLMCVSYRLPKAEAQIKILKIELERYKQLANSLGTRIEGHFLTCKDQVNLQAGLDELRELEEDQ